MRVALAVAVASLAVVAPVAAATAHLRLVDSTPVTLRGASFGAGERVAVRAKLGDDSAKRFVRADDAGRFLVRFPGFAYDRCHGALIVEALGARGTHAGFSIEPLDCPAGGGST